ncbi:MAG: hypothetical protein GX458_08605 [Phyllobacteriaceae bacterium]|nr:hypothetical protein [Phyllobacteriaceae bacterium]
MIPTSNDTIHSTDQSAGWNARWKAAFGALAVALLWFGIAVETPRPAPSAGAFGRSVADATVRRLLLLGARERATTVATARVSDPPRADRGPDAGLMPDLDRIALVDTALGRAVRSPDAAPTRPAFAFQPRGPPEVVTFAAA